VRSPDAGTVSSLERQPDQFETLMLTAFDTARRRSTVRAWIIRIGALAVVLVAWQLAPQYGLVSPELTSKPTEVASAFKYYFVTADIWIDIRTTFEASLLGLLIGASTGIAVGVLFAKSFVLERAFRPYVTILNALPRVALAPIFLVWFGLGLESKVFVSASIVFFVLLLNTMAGLLGVDPDIDFLASALSMSQWQRFRLIQLPSALPSIAAGLRLGAVYAVLGSVVVEMIASYHGLGQVLVVATTNLQMGRSFAIIIVITFIAVILDLLVSLLERLVRRHQIKGG